MIMTILQLLPIYSRRNDQLLDSAGAALGVSWTAALEVADNGIRKATTAEMAKEAMANLMDAVKLPEVSAR